MPSEPETPTPDDTTIVLISEAEQLLLATVAQISEDVSVTTQLRHGKPAPELVLPAVEHQAQLVVLGHGLEDEPHRRRSAAWAGMRSFIACRPEW